MKRTIVSVAVLGVILQGQSSFAKSLEDVLKEKGVITQQDYEEISKSQQAATKEAQPAKADNLSVEHGSAGGINFKMKGITVNLGGFIEAAGIYRSRNLNSDMSSKFQALPLANSQGYYQDEIRFSARQSRLSLLVQGDATPAIHLAGYYEMDFLGAANSANSKESNSYNPRVRHLYTTADWDTYGLHLLGGQTWSLVTMNNMGITPRNEVTPLTIDAQYVPGFTWARQPGFRIVKDMFDKKLWLAFSVENPQTVAGGKATPSATATNLALNQTGGGNLDGVTVSVNDTPDFVFKVAYEPGWGHFELYDLVRTFGSTVNPAGTGVLNRSHITTTAFGGGFILPLIPKKLTLTASAAYGEGIGRYGSAQLPDVAQDANGNLVPIRELQYLFGLSWDPTSDLNLYTYYGSEQVCNTKAAPGGVGYGYGSNNSGSGTFGGTVDANVKRVSQLAAGAWWKFFQGKYGKMQAGLQYSYTTDKYFDATKGGAPTANDHMVFTSLRYYWQ
ncbi:MAG TPA: hypothetical protein VF799_03440 [Geobacteraceae bacterium]